MNIRTDGGHPPEKEPSPLLTRKAVALRLGISISMVDKLRRAKKLTARLVGRQVRFTETDLQSYLESVREDQARPAGRKGKKRSARGEPPPPPPRAA